MSPNLEQSIQKVSDKVDSHHKSSVEFYTEMRIGAQNTQAILQDLQKSVINTKIRVENIEREYEKDRNRIDTIEKKLIWLIAWSVFLGFLVLVLLAQ